MYPFFTLFGKTFSSYGLMMTVGFALAIVLSYLRGRKKGLSFYDLMIVAAFTLLFALIVGVVLYVFVTYPVDEILQIIREGNWSMFGGLVFYGGLIGGVFGAILGARVAGIKLSLLEHSVVPFLPLGHAMGRIGCTLAGCCHGMEYSGFGALYYPDSIFGLSANQGYFPVQPLEALLNLGVMGILLWYGRKERKTFSMLFAYLAIYAVERFSLEFLRGDAVRGIFGGVSVSQWISIGMLTAAVLFFVLSSVKAKKAESK